MRKTTQDIQVPLTPEQIDEMSDRITAFLKDLDTDKKEILRIRLSAEEALLRWQSRFSPEKEVHLHCGFSFGQPVIRITLDGEQYNPLEEDETGTQWSRKLLSGLQTTPLYSYKDSHNAITFKLVRKPVNPLLLLGIALGASAVVGVAGLWIPESVRTAAVDGFLTPLCTTYLNVLNFFGIPLIFLTLILGICGIGDSSFFGRIGKKMVVYYLAFLALATALAAAIAFPFFTFNFGGQNTAFAFKDLFSLILGFLPTSLVTPFVECNAMQLVVMAVVMGIAVLKLSPVADGLANTLEDLDQVLVLISTWYAKLIPFFTFFIIVRGLWTDSLSAFASMWKPWLIVTLLQAVLIGFTVTQTCLRHKVSFATVMKKLSNTFFIGFGTNSCCATIPEIFNCTAHLGVDAGVMNLGIPVGTTVFKPSCAIRYVVLSMSMVSFYGLGVNAAWFCLAILLSALLSVAAPAIPGGAMVFYPMLFTQLGLPAEAATLMLATDIFFDALCTGFSQVNAEIAMLHQAGRLDLLDVDTLKK